MVYENTIIRKLKHLQLIVAEKKATETCYGQTVTQGSNSIPPSSLLRSGSIKTITVI